ncbi:MAG TPA: type VI secretion system baseplate subunit TssE [Acidobacteria bacterium]|nr:type VI secretion system baseplate subunit TssE [Acidobacteriota bacterium]
MHHALFEVLTGEYADGRPVPPVAGVAEVRRSVQDHLTRLLNARRGSLQHLPDYGLPDIAPVYQGLPYTINDLVDNIRNTILRYEPRLVDVQVKARNVKQGDHILYVDIDARLSSGHEVRFETYFYHGRAAEVRPRRQRERQQEPE